MEEFYKIFSDYLNGKSIYLPIRRMLSLILNLMISSHFYTLVYGKYYWYNISDYKLILNFLIQGKFIIPLSFFIIIYSVIHFLSMVFFQIFSNWRVRTISKQIQGHVFTNEELMLILDEIKPFFSRVSLNISDRDVLKVSKFITQNIKSKDIKELSKELTKPIEKMQENFLFLLRIIIAISVYKIVDPNYGWGLFITTIVVLLFSLYILIMASRFLAILPAIFNLVRNQAQQYIIDNYKQNGEISIVNE